MDNSTLEKYINDYFSFNDGELISKQTGMIVGTPDRRGKQTYLSVCIMGKRFYVHRILFWCYHKYWPNLIDHDDNNGLNNSISNLIDRTHSQNLVNSTLRTDNKSGYSGVSWNKKCKKWEVQFRKKYLGVFSSLEEALKIRRDEEDKFWHG